MKVYIAGKISGLPHQQAFNRFAHFESLLESYGHEVTNPMRLPHAPDSEWEDYMALDIFYLMQCDAVFLIPGWRDSKGARLEAKLATYMRKRLIDGPDQLPPVIQQLGIFPTV